MTTKKMKPAGNRYRQVRVTYTEEASGRMSVRAYAKPLDAPWTERQCILTMSLPAGGPCETVEDVYLRLEGIFVALRLPESRT